MPDSTGSVQDALIKLIGGVLAAVATACMAHWLGHRRGSDRELLRFLRLVFDRPAFRGPFSWQTDPKPFHEAIGLTIKALSTGVLLDRQGHELAKGRPVSDLRRRSWRHSLQGIPADLKEVQQLMYICQTNAPHSPEVAAKIDSGRDSIIRKLNAIFVAQGIDPLPIPTEVADSTSVWEREIDS
jgi:hypothetical protein